MFRLINGLLSDGGHTTIASVVNNADQSLFNDVINSLAVQLYSERFYFANVKRMMDAKTRSVTRDIAYNVDLTTENEDPYESFYDLSVLSEQMNEFFGS